MPVIYNRSPYAAGASVAVIPVTATGHILLPEAVQGMIPIPPDLDAKVARQPIGSVYWFTGDEVGDSPDKVYAYLVMSPRKYDAVDYFNTEEALASLVKWLTDLQQMGHFDEIALERPISSGAGTIPLAPRVFVRLVEEAFKNMGGVSVVLSSEVSPHGPAERLPSALSQDKALLKKTVARAVASRQERAARLGAELPAKEIKRLEPRFRSRIATSERQAAKQGERQATAAQRAKRLAEQAEFYQEQGESPEGIKMREGELYAKEPAFRKAAKARKYAGIAAAQASPEFQREFFRGVTVEEEQEARQAAKLRPLDPVFPEPLAFIRRKRVKNPPPSVYSTFISFVPADFGLTKKEKAAPRVSRDTDQAEVKRAYILADYALRQFAPAALAETGHASAANRLGALRPVNDSVAAKAAILSIYEGLGGKPSILGSLGGAKGYHDYQNGKDTVEAQAFGSLSAALELLRRAVRADETQRLTDVEANEIGYFAAYAATAALASGADKGVLDSEIKQLAYECKSEYL
jgi:hypothetical protein